MSTLANGSFDSLATRYDELWSMTPAGRYQRERVWKLVDPLFRSGEKVLDIGCGTGVDALWLMSRGVRVDAIDASAAMVGIAQAKGVNAYHLPAEKLSSISTVHDGAISNFGVLNCVSNLSQVSADLGALIRPRGYLAICVMGAFCLWETCHFLRSGQFKKAVRRWSGGPVTTSLGVRVWYPRVSAIAKALRRDFRLVHCHGIGLAIPPSYVRGLSNLAAARLASLDDLFSSWPLLRGMADHRLLVFSRI